MPSGGSLHSAEEGGNATSWTAAGGASEPSTAVSPTEPGSTAVVVDGKGELWWRYESLGEGVVKDRTRDRVSAAGVKGGAGSGCGEAAEGLPSERDGRGGTEEDLMVRVNCPIRVLDPKHGVYECHPLGKEAQTVGE